MHPVEAWREGGQHLATSWYEAYVWDRDLGHPAVPGRFSNLPVLGIIRAGTLTWDDRGPLAPHSAVPIADPPCTAHWNGRGVAFTCFMLAATLFGGNPPINDIRWRLWNPWLRSLPSKDGAFHVEAEGGKAPRPGVAAHKYPHTPSIYSYLPFLFASVSSGIASLSRCVHLSIYVLSQARSCFIHSFPSAGSRQPRSFTSDRPCGLLHSFRISTLEAAIVILHRYPASLFKLGICPYPTSAVQQSHRSSATMRTSLALMSLLPVLASATPAPIYPGFNLLWSESFEGSPGQLPNETNWNLITE